MARTPAQPRRAEIAPDELELFDDVVGRQRRAYAPDAPPEEERELPFWGSLLQSPPFAAALSRYVVLVRTAGDRPDSYSHADREWVDQVLSYDWDYYGVLGVHTPDAVAVGVRIEAIEALRDGREEDLNEDERLLTTHIRQVVNGTVDDETYAAIERRLGPRGAVEYTTFITLLQLIIRLFMAFDVAAPTRADVDDVIEGLKNGTIEVPDPRAHIR